MAEIPTESESEGKEDAVSPLVDVTAERPEKKLKVLKPSKSQLELEARGSPYAAAMTPSDDTIPTLLRPGTLTAPRQSVVAQNRLTVNEEYTRRLTEIFEKHNPEKVKKIRKLLLKYRSKEQELYERICTKYKVPALPPPRQARRGRASELPLGLEAVMTESADELIKHIQVWCRFRPPNKVELAKEIEFMFKHKFNMSSKDYEVFKQLRDDALELKGPVVFPLNEDGDEFTKIFKKFTTEDVVLWLEAHELGEYKRFFRTKKINGAWLVNPPPYNERKPLEITPFEVINFYRENQNHRYKMDGVLDMKSTQNDVFRLIGEDLVNSVVQGFNCTVFAYGQTGTGKTHTMFGPDGGRAKVGMDRRGLIPRSIEKILNILEMDDSVDEAQVHIAIMEIYHEKLKDLLTPGVKLILRYVGRDSQVDNLSWFKVDKVSQALQYIDLAMTRRQTAAHNANETSSRSHAIITLKLNITMRGGNVKTSKLNLADLAGSERTTKTGVRGTHMREAQDILKSLFALQNVIRALSDKKAFVPYQGGLLTKLLRDSLGGNSRTSIIIACSPHEFNRSETVATLGFGEQAKKIANEPVINRVLSREEMESQLSRMKEELQYLRRLKPQQGGPPPPVGGSRRDLLAPTRTSRAFSGASATSQPGYLRSTSIYSTRDKTPRGGLLHDEEDEMDAMQEGLKAANIVIKQQQIKVLEKDSQLVDLEKELHTKDQQLSKLSTQMARLRGKTVAPEIDIMQIPRRKRSKTAERWRMLFLHNPAP